MAKQTYDVRHAFQSSEGWICRETSSLIAKLPEKEVATALKQGLIVETTGTMSAAEQTDAAAGSATTTAGEPAPRARGGR